MDYTEHLGETQMMVKQLAAVARSCKYYCNSRRYRIAFFRWLLLVAGGGDPLSGWGHQGTDPTPPLSAPHKNPMEGQPFHWRRLLMTNITYFVLAAVKSWFHLRYAGIFSGLSTWVYNGYDFSALELPVGSIMYPSTIFWLNVIIFSSLQYDIFISLKILQTKFKCQLPAPNEYQFFF